MYFTADQIDQYAKDGFLVVRRMYSGHDLQQIVAAATRLADAEPVAGGPWMYFANSILDGRKIINRIEKYVEHDADLAALALGEVMLSRVFELSGKRAVLFKDKINYKMPGGDGFKPHQDNQAGWDKYCAEFMSVLVCLDENTEQNGCLELAAGIHTRGLIGETWEPLGPEELKDISFVRFPSLPGDVVFFDGYTPHQSGPNLSDRRRANLYLTYNRFSDGDHREQYYADKYENFPPDIERDPNKTYVYRV